MRESARPSFRPWPGWEGASFHQCPLDVHHHAGTSALPDGTLRTAAQSRPSDFRSSLPIATSCQRLHRSRSTARVLSLGVLAVLLFSLLQRLSLHTISRVIHPQLFLLPSSALLYPLACIRWLSNAAWRSSPRPPLPEGVDLVDVMVGTGGDTPNGSGGMIPSTAPPFGMTRWVAQTRENVGRLASTSTSSRSLIVADLSMLKVRVLDTI